MSTLAGEHLFLLNHPQLVKDVLVTNQKSFFKGRGLERCEAPARRGPADQRRRDAPAATAADAAGLSPRSDRLVRLGDDQVADHVQRAGPTAARSTSRQQMRRLTLAVVGQTLFGADVESYAQRVGQVAHDRPRFFLADDAAVVRRAGASPVAALPRDSEGDRRARRDYLWPDRRAAQVPRRSRRSAVHAADGAGRGGRRQRE